MSDDWTVGRSDELARALVQLVTFGDEMPASVAAAAKALFDWSRVDAHLAEIAASDAPLVRDSESALRWTAQQVAVEVAVEELGWRRRRLLIDVTIGSDADTSAEFSVTLQQANGETIAVHVDDIGDRVAEVRAGAVRVVVESGHAAIRTPWFTV